MTGSQAGRDNGASHRDTPVIGAWPALHPTTQAAYNQILWDGGLPKTEVAAKLHLSRTRMTTIARDLGSAGLIVEGGREQRSSTGRPAEMLFARTDRFYFLGVHIRAAEVVAAVNDVTNRVVWENRAMPAALSTTEILEFCRSSFSAASATGLVVAAAAVCGSMQQIDGAPQGVDLCTLISEDVRAQLEHDLGVPVAVEDDIIALTAFEQWPRLAEGQDSMALISLGTEVGLGLVVDRKIVVGARGRAGQWSHVPVDEDGVECPRGHRGCLWSTSSTTALAHAAGSDGLDSALERAAAGDDRAHVALTRAARGIGSAGGYIVNLLDPDKLVLTGGSRALLDGYFDAFVEGFESACLDTALPEIDIASFDFLEWARAAAGLALYRTLGGSFR